MAINHQGLVIYDSSSVRSFFGPPTGRGRHTLFAALSPRIPRTRYLLFFFFFHKVIAHPRTSSASLRHPHPALCQITSWSRLVTFPVIRPTPAREKPPSPSHRLSFFVGDCCEQDLPRNPTFRAIHLSPLSSRPPRRLSSMPFSPSTLDVLLASISTFSVSKEV